MFPHKLRFSSVKKLVNWQIYWTLSPMLELLLLQEVKLLEALSEDAATMKRLFLWLLERRANNANSLSPLSLRSCNGSLCPCGKHWTINTNNTWSEHTLTHTVCPSPRTRTHLQTTGDLSSPSVQTLLSHSALLCHRRPQCRTPLRLRPPAPLPSPTHPHLRSPTLPSLAGRKHLELS